MKFGRNIITDGLILHLDAANTKSYPGSGTNYNDISNNGIVATLVNSPTVNSYGSITLDGINQYIQVTSDGTTSGFNTQNFTIDGWINMTNDGAYNVLWSYDYLSHSSPFYAQEVQVVNGSHMQFVGNRNSGTAYYALSGGITMLTYDNWYNFTVVRDTANGMIHFYKDGVFIVSRVDTNTITYYNQEVWIGRANYSTGYYKGDIGPYKFYNRALTAEEVAQNYKALKSRFLFTPPTFTPITDTWQHVYPGSTQASGQFTIAGSSATGPGNTFVPISTVYLYFNVTSYTSTDYTSEFNTLLSGDSVKVTNTNNATATYVINGTPSISAGILTVPVYYSSCIDCSGQVLDEGIYTVEFLRN